MPADLNSETEDTNQKSEKPVQPTRTSFIKDLLSRRVPHILGAYLAASWIILEFMDWLVRRYPISPHLVEFCLVAEGVEITDKALEQLPVSLACNNE